MNLVTDEKGKPVDPATVEYYDDPSYVPQQEPTNEVLDFGNYDDKSIHGLDDAKNQLKSVIERTCTIVNNIAHDNILNPSMFKNYLTGTSQEVVTKSFHEFKDSVIAPFLYNNNFKGAVNGEIIC